MPLSDEARRQQRLLAAIAAITGNDVDRDVAPGLAVYRANAAATAERALAAVFPTVRTMVGDEAFSALARGHWRDDPPVRGDLGEWGLDLPAWLDAQPGLSDWPWLADSARLDWALHVNERAADVRLDNASLRALGEADPATQRLELASGAALIESRFPIVTIHAAHQEGGDLATARAALDEGRAETAFVVRHGWRAVVHAVDAPTAAWLRALIEGTSLADALQAAGDGFDFGAWFAEALRHGWLEGARELQRGTSNTSGPPSQTPSDSTSTR